MNEIVANLDVSYVTPSSLTGQVVGVYAGEGPVDKNGFMHLEALLRNLCARGISVVLTNPAELRLFFGKALPRAFHTRQVCKIFPDQIPRSDRL
jgi:hypothetical protein